MPDVSCAGLDKTREFVQFDIHCVPEHQLCPSSVQVLCKLIQSLRLVLRLFKVLAEFSVALEFVTDGSAGL